MERIREWIGELLGEVRTWCRGRIWIGRLIFWLWLAWIGVQHWRDPMYNSFLGGLNLGIHEFGHLICSPLGQFMGVLGGSLVQCLVPLVSLWMFYRQSDYFAWSFSLVWLGTNLFGVAVYMADARALKLDLVSPFGGGDSEIIHDWNWLFHELGWLHWNLEIATGVRVLAWHCLATGLAWGAWVLWLMLTAPKKEIGEDWPEPK
jgi:hypothetical protein